MTAATVRGWCPSLHEPMAALDGLIVRVKPRVRGLSADDLRSVAAAADQAGAGALELTARGALQVRGLDADGAALFARLMVEADLASADVAIERRRNLQLGVGCGPTLLALAAAVETWLESDADLSALPAKFGFAVSPDEPIPADIVVVGEDAAHVLIGGEAAIALHPPDQVGERRNGGHVEALDAVQRLTGAFLRLARRQPVPPRRMKGLIRAVGADAVLEEAGIQAVDRPRSPDRRGPKLGPRLGGPGPGGFGPGGFGPDGFGLGVVFGALTSGALRVAADLADRHGDGGVMLAPGRVIWLPGVARADQRRLSAAAAAAGFVADPEDRSLRLDACIGRAGCARATEDVRADALRLAFAAPAAGLHVAGCAKGCAHPGVAGVTLVSRGKPGRYDLILNGAPSAPPTSADLRLDQIAAYLSEPPP